ncbi:MAG: translation elongation factor Ts [Deltaproteobacteria bacterium]|jgi:elongation factor Ts|nr:translation elongation factor Ts [Deltaproteobacteria bacterium]
MEISARLVKELRDRTNAGMMDCKKALQECAGDMEAAVDWLRQKGLSKAARKAGRATGEGLVASRLAGDNASAAIVEVMCETDFVSRGEQFRRFAASVAEAVFTRKPESHAALLSLLGDGLNNQIATLGENMSIGRHAFLEVSAAAGLVSCYIHSNGKIGVLVELACENQESAKKPELQELGKNIAMQVAAANPAALDKESLDPALVERERAVYRQKTLDEGKPANIVDKIVDGRINKFYQEVCLLNQAYIRDDKLSVNDVVNACAKALADKIAVRRFVRFQLGESSPA